MKAIISGQAATAVYSVQDILYAIEIDSPHPIKCTWADMRSLFQFASDMIEINVSTIDDIRNSLELEWAKDRSLRLFLLVINPETIGDIREDAADCLEEMLENSLTIENILFRIYSQPLPETADIVGASHIAQSNSYIELFKLLKEIERDQDSIRERYEAWQSLPLSLFNGNDEKEELFHILTTHGASRMFVSQEEQRNGALVRLLTHPEFRGDHNITAILREWAAPFQETSTGTAFYSYVKEDEYYKDNGYNRSRDLRSAREKLNRVEKQKEAIKQRLQQGRTEEAWQYTEDLIQSQYQDQSTPVHIAKSLCSLAQFAKSLGNIDLQRLFSERAVAEAPTDAWSHATLGDAYRGLAEFQLAMDSYQKAGDLGDSKIALAGRAEIFKDLGNFKDAVQLYDQCALLYPNDIVINNGRAAALAASGKLKNALDTYKTIIEQSGFYADVVTLTGHAQVLRDMGRLDEALNELDIICQQYPDSIVAFHARGEVLRELGNLDAAQKVFRELKTQFPLYPHAETSYARICRDKGNFEEALEIYNKVKEEYPWHASSYTGIADTLRKVGRLDEALVAYSEAIDRFPKFLSLRIGKASVLSVMEDFSSAMAELPDTPPATAQEWAAFHAGGMLAMKMNNLPGAEKIFIEGLNHNPWGKQRDFFRTALASLRIRQQYYPEAIKLANGVKHPAISTLARLLAMHAHGAQGDFTEFEIHERALPKNIAPPVIQLRHELLQQQMDLSAQLRDNQSELRIIKMETNALLLST